MNRYLQLDITQAKPFFTDAEYNQMKEEVVAAHRTL